MPSPTLLECFDKYIPDHIFKDIVLEPDPFCENCCIVIDGCGMPHCFQFTKDEPLKENLVLKNGDYYHSRVHVQEVPKWLHMKVWFMYKPYSEIETEEQRADIIKRMFYDIWTFDCHYCKQTYVGPSYRCLFCRECNNNCCGGYASESCAAKVCIACFTGDPGAVREYTNDKVYLTYGGKTVEYINGYEIYRDNCESTHCWRHSGQN